MIKYLFPLIIGAGLLIPGCKDPGPLGPDGKPLPGSPKGPAIPNPRQLKDPPTASFVLPVEGVVRKDMKDHPNDKEREFQTMVEFEVEQDNPNPPPPTIKTKRTLPVTVKWTRLDNGGYQFTFLNGTTVTAVPTPDGKAEWKTVSTAKAGEHYGPSVLFVAIPAGCQDAIWVQYVKREFKFYDANGVDKGTPVLGPEIDLQFPYQNQEQPSPGGPVMEDAPGVNGQLGEQPKDTAPGAVDKIKRDAGVTDTSITKAVETWSFWSYLICLNPNYQVLGHYEWGFTLTVDTKNDPYIMQSDTRDPSWTAGK